MRPNQQSLPTRLGNIPFNTIFALLVCFQAAQLAFAEYPVTLDTNAWSARKLEEAELKSESLHRMSVDAIKHVNRLPIVLPLLVDSLFDPNKEVRFTAVKAIHAAARRVERAEYMKRPAPDWTVLEPHFVAALERLKVLQVYSRTERVVATLLERKQQSGKVGSQPTLSPASFPIGKDAALLLDEFRRLREDQIVEMWRLTKNRFPKFDSSTQISMFEELLSIADPRYFEFALILTDDFDDAIIQASLNSQLANLAHLPSVDRSDSNGKSQSLHDLTLGEHEEPSSRQLSEHLILQHARPQSAEVQKRLADLISQDQISQTSQSGMLNCLENGSSLEPGLADAIAEEYLANPEIVRQSDFYRFLLKHKQNVAPELMNSVIEQGLATIRNTSKDTWERSEAMASLTSLAPGHSGLLQCAKEILDGATHSNEELLRETLLTLPAHGSACKSVTKQLLSLSQAQDEVICQCAIEGLEKVGNIDHLAIERLVERLKSSSESPSMKLAIAKILRSNGKAASKILHAHLTSELQSNHQQRAVVDLLQAAEVVGQREAPLATLCQEIASDHKLPLTERLAAIHTSPSCSAQKQVSIDFLQSLIQNPKEYVEIKAAAMEALANVAGSQAIPTLAEFTNHEDPLLSCSARYGYHLAGESNTSVHLLMQQLYQASIASTAEALLLEIGSQGERAFYEVLDSDSATIEQQQLAYRVLAGSSSPDWRRLLVYLKDESDADEFEESLRTAWNFDLKIIPPLFEQIEAAPVDSAVAARAWSLADDFTSGLGSDTDTSNSQSAIRRAIAYSASSASTRDFLSEVDANPPAAASPPPVLMEAPAVEAPVAIAPINPAPKTAVSVPVQAPIESAQHVELEPGVLRSVEVFYGTNRQPNYTTAFGSKLQWGAFAIAMFSIVVCLFGFLYQRLVAYSLAAVFGLLGLAMLANDSLDYSYWFPDLARTYSGNYSEEVKYGVCEVTIPKSHVVGQLESPSLFMKLEVRSDPSKHVVLKETKVLSEKEFFDKLHVTMDDQGNNLLVFIHGYNVSFNDAARRTAQMAVDLDFQGAPVFYSWPSYSDWYRYPDDAENIQRSVGQIRQFLEKLACDSGATSINLVAHSMGNVGLTQALAGLDSSVPLFNQVVLAAPDIDASTFEKEIAPKLTSKAKRVTLYTSQTDLALLASRYFNSGIRVGDSSYGVKVFPGIETIDATSIDSSLLGHSYYGSSKNVLEDIANLFSDRPISDRTYLHMIENVSPPYWSFSRVPRMAEAVSPPTRQ